MRSPLELIKGDFDHALFTTYTLNLPFFERWVMPILGEAGIRNIVVIADADRLGDALADPHVRLAGRRYHLHGIATRGVFHSKLILLTSKGHARLCVSSANLTISGQLRNLESLTAFDSNLAGHGEVIAEATEYLRRLADEAPPHVRTAVGAAVANVDGDGSPPPARFLHNLDEPIVDRIPEAPLRAVAPFADAAAATRLSSHGTLTVVVDGAEFAADSAFFGQDWHIEPRRFDRPLHGKMYRTEDGRWGLVGSPNLTEAALLRTAAAGNFEAAVAFAGRPPDPPSSTWDGEPIHATAPRRRETSMESVETQTHQVAFAAWEQSGKIAVSGIPDGTDVEYAVAAGWRTLGAVRDGTVDVPEGTRPYLLRASVDGRPGTAIVHRPDELRNAARPRLHTRASSVLSGLPPLDPQGQRTLEVVLDALHTLVDRLHDERAPSQSSFRRARPAQVEDAAQLSQWLPANPDDEPRIPDLYQRTWAERKEPDVLLALARIALRIDSITDPIPSLVIEEELVSDEGRDLDDLDDRTDSVESPETPADTAPRIPADVLNRYRNDFLKRLGKFAKVITRVDRQDLADLTFQVVLQQHERLTTTEVDVDGTTEHLVDPETLLPQKLELITAYLKTGGSDPGCMETMRYHLAECLRNRSVWSPLEWERLERLTYEHGRRILDTPLPLRPVDRLLEMHIDDAEGWIQEFVARTDWAAITEHAAEYLSEPRLHTEPFPHITGSAEFVEISHAPGGEGSPAWDIIGYGAVAGLSDDDPYGVAITNEGADGYYVVHALVVAPGENKLYEGVLRRADRTWMWRHYKPVGMKVLKETARYGPAAMSDAYRSSFQECSRDELPEPLRDVAVRAAGDGSSGA